MIAAADVPAREERLDLLDALIYGDVFDCAVTLDELWRYGRRPIELDELRSRLSRDPVLRAVVRERGGLYCLAGREALLELRPARRAHARELQRRGMRVARLLRHAPFVRGLALTGSAAADYAARDADVDLLVVVAPGRVGVAFVLLGSLSRLLGRRLFCPNWYLAADHLAVGPHDLYVARELAQARALAGPLAPLHAANGWLGSVLPNSSDGRQGEPPLQSGGPVQRLIEAPLRGGLGDALERRARRLATSRLKAHYGILGQPVPAAVSASLDDEVGLQFHARAWHGWVLERYEDRRREVAALLQGTEQS